MGEGLKRTGLPATCPCIVDLCLYFQQCLDFDLDER